MREKLECWQVGQESNLMGTPNALAIVSHNRNTGDRDGGMRFRVSGEDEGMSNISPETPLAVIEDRANGMTCWFSSSGKPLRIMLSTSLDRGASISLKMHK